MAPGRIRVVSIMEAQFVTGPAKNLLAFAEAARNPQDGLPGVDISVITYLREETHEDAAAARVSSPFGDPATPPARNAFIAAAERAGLPVDIIHERRRFDRSILEQIPKVIAARDPDIVQTHNSKSHFLMRYLGLHRKYPWIAFHHGYTTTDLKMRMYHGLDHWSLRAAAHAVTVCGPFRDQLIARGVKPERITVQHNVIREWQGDRTDPGRSRAARALRQSLGIGDQTPVLLTVGRLSHEKGHLDLLNAFAEVIRAGTDAHLVIVGEGPERAAIEAATARYGLQARVTLAGHQNQVQSYYDAADFFLMPSHSEGSPNALLEAIAAGVPVIASRTGGIPEIITHEATGLLTPPRNPPALAAAIRSLLGHPERAAALAARASKEIARFSPITYRRTISEVYKKVLKHEGA
jgi:glycosyltransferase involved in cell wall biosynthesis